ncbi:MAG: DUF1552 domain-containing protein [Myxococcota bacterium]
MNRNRPRNRDRVKERRFGRRPFLIGAGATLALPPLVSLMPKDMAAQVGSDKKVRAVIYVGMMGVDHWHLTPEDPPGMTQAPGESDVFYKPLTGFSGPISRMIDGDFASVLPKMNLMHGLSLTGGSYQGHNSSVLSGTHSGHREPIYGKSIDVILEQSPGVYGPSEVVPLKALRISNRPTEMTFDRVGGERTHPSVTMGDQNVFNQLFGGMTPDPMEEPTHPFPDELIVDRVLEDLRALEGNPRLSRADNQILDRYVSGVHEVQNRIRANQMGVAPSCSAPSIPFQANTSGNGFQFPWNSNWGVRDAGVLYDNIMDMIQLAFACDLTRVVFIANTHWSNDPISPSSQGGIHHECPSSEASADRQKWGLKKMLRLAESLDGTPDPLGEGTLLDNSLLLWTNELGAWTTAHNTFSIPAVTFGSGGGYFTTGNFVDFRQRPLERVKNFYPGRPYKQLLQSVMSSMGVPAGEYMAFGDGNGFGEFQPRIRQFSLDRDVFSRYASVHNDPLPFVTA